MTTDTESQDSGPTQPSKRLLVADAAAWHAWLKVNESTSDGVRLVLAKTGITAPTTLTYAQALEEALCSGWIDGRRNRIDEATFQQHFTPRRKTSIWSKRNVTIVEALVGSGRMRPRGHTEIQLAKADSRWDRAYSGQAKAEVPQDLARAVAASPAAAVRFKTLTRAERYTAIHQVITSPNAPTRTNRIRKILLRWETSPEPL